MEEFATFLLILAIALAFGVVGMTLIDSDGIELFECQQRFEEITGGKVVITRHTEHRGLSGDSNDVWFDLDIDGAYYNAHCVGSSADRLVCIIFNWEANSD